MNENLTRIEVERGYYAEQVEAGGEGEGGGFSGGGGGGLNSRA